MMTASNCCGKENEWGGGCKGAWYQQVRASFFERRIFLGQVGRYGPPRANADPLAKVNPRREVKPTRLVRKGRGGIPSQNSSKQTDDLVVPVSDMVDPGWDGHSRHPVNITPLHC